MSNKYWEYVIIVIQLILCDIALETTQETCTNCIPLRECSIFMSMLDNAENSSSKQETLQYLRTQQCGFQDGYPKVCCTSLPETSISATTKNNTCQTNTDCIILKNCQSYMTLIASMEKPLKRSVVDFLRSQECGFEKGYPKVCCSHVPKSFQTLKHARPSGRRKFNKLSALHEDMQIIQYSALPMKRFVTVTTSTSTTTTTKKPATRKRNRGVFLDKQVALNDAFLSSDDFDMSGPFDLMLRKREKRYNSDNNQLDIEIR